MAHCASAVTASNDEVHRVAEAPLCAPPQPPRTAARAKRRTRQIRIGSPGRGREEERQARSCALPTCSRPRKCAHAAVSCTHPLQGALCREGCRAVSGVRIVAGLHLDNRTRMASRTLIDLFDERVSSRSDHAALRYWSSGRWAGFVRGLESTGEPVGRGAGGRRRRTGRARRAHLEHAAGVGAERHGDRDGRGRVGPCLPDEPCAAVRAHSRRRRSDHRDRRRRGTASEAIERA